MAPPFSRSQSLFGLFDVLYGEFSRLNQMRHYQFCSATEQRQQLVNQSTLRVVSRDDRLKDICVADALDATQGLLPFQAIYGGLHCRIGRSCRRRKRLVDLAH